MVIRSLSVKNIRSHREFEARPSATTTIITGANGSGKTSLIEAITVALGGKSFKGTDSELLRQGASWWRIDMQLDDQERTVKYQPENDSKRKQFIIDSKTTARLPSAKRYPVVLFEPDDLRLLHGSPVRRRQFIDRLAAQLFPGYDRTVRRYERALYQRNKLLKNQATNESLFPWNVSLAKYGAQVVETRTRLIERLNSELEMTYGTIAGTRDAVSIHYSHTLISHTEQKLLTELEGQTERDKLLGHTSIGPHRHDVLIRFNDAPAISTTSRGETRTVILALKFLEVDLIKETIGQKPIILLDDVFSELDEQRQTHLATNFQNHQIIMTSTSMPKILNRAKTIELSL